MLRLRSTSAWSHYVLGLSSWLIAIAGVQAGPQQTVEGQVDGQKFGTNLVGGGVSIHFVGDSEPERRLLDACDTGDRCKVVVVTNPGNVVVRLLTAVRVTSDLSPGAADVDRPLKSLVRPSFDCKLGDSPIEQMICADSQLAALDLDLAGVYRTRIDTDLSQRAQLRQQQRNWIVQVRNLCADVHCVRAAYRERINALKR